MRARGSMVVCSVLLSAFPIRAAAPQDLEAVQSPRVAYDRATKAWKAGDKEAAAHWFARADALEASDRALGSALQAAISAKLAPLGMALAARADRAPADAELTRLAKDARLAFGASTGRVEVDCGAAGVCEPALDGLPLPEAGYTTLGAHEVSWSCPDGRKSEQVNVDAGSARRVNAICAGVAASKTQPAEPPSELPGLAPAPPSQGTTPAPVHDRSTGAQTEARPGLSPTWFWVGVGATAVLSGITVWSGLDTKARHDDYVNGGRQDDTLRSGGESAQQRTNLLLAGTGIAALVTAGIGLFAVDFGSSSLEASITPDPTLPKLGLEGRF